MLLREGEASEAKVFAWLTPPEFHGRLYSRQGPSWVLMKPFEKLQMSSLQAGTLSGYALYYKVHPVYCRHTLEIAHDVVAQVQWANEELAAMVASLFSRHVCCKGRFDQTVRSERRLRGRPRSRGLNN